MSLAPGRDGDWRMLEARYAAAKSERDRAVVRRKMDALRRESTDPTVRNLRLQLVQAARDGNNEAGERIGELIYEHQRKQGKVR